MGRRPLSSLPGMDPEHQAEVIAAHETELGEDEADGLANGETQNSYHRKRQQNFVFDAWYRQQAAATDFSSVKASRHKSDQQEQETIKELLRKRHGRKIIGSEYAFQTELFERAKSQNTIVVADTGAGKTLISINLVKHVMDQEIEARAKGGRRKIAIFVVDKVALMFQQADSLKANLRYEVAEICGYTNPHLWDQKKWIDIFIRHDIVVCTAEVLQQCLMRAFIRMTDISLLIFDEAHHAKKEHPYARIMSDFYIANPNNDPRPRIFGMTASPVDVQDVEDILEGARELESLLQSKIATCSTADMEDKRARPKEDIIHYTKSMHSSVTPMYTDLQSKFSGVKHFSALFERAREIGHTLGPWCADAYWSFAFSEKESKKCAAKAEREFSRREHDSEEHRAKLDKEIAALHAAQDAINELGMPIPTATPQDLGPKVVALQEVLLQHFERPSDTRCLVFVTRRETAKLLHLLFEKLEVPNLSSGCLVGSTARDFEGQRSSFRQQQATIHQFRTGKVNCLFATSVAEEGLDIPECNIVIRFDPCRTMIQFIQSRGRARQKNSRFVHILEWDNQEEAEHLVDLHDSEQIMQSFCSALPQDRVITDDDAEDDIIARQLRYPTYEIKSTNTKLTYHFSLSVLNHFVDSIPRDETDDMTVRYAVFMRDGKFMCEVTLPERANISPVVGRPYTRKMVAKMSAAFETCKVLRKQGLLNDRLLPIYTEQLHHMRNARLALKSAKQHAYEAQIKPKIWAQDRGSFPNHLFVTSLIIRGSWERPVRHVALLTRRRLPELFAFPLYRLNGQSLLEPRSLADPIVVNDSHVSKLSWFTLTVMKDVYNKTFEDVPEKMSYWLAPMISQVQGSAADARLLLDWSLMDTIYQKTPIKWNEALLPEALLEKFVMDPWDGGRRFFTKRIAPELNPFDQIPEGVAAGPPHSHNIVEYSTGLFKKSKARRTWHKAQPVIVAEKILHRLNVLDEPNTHEQSAITRCFICPEPLDISHLPIDVVAFCLVFPAIIYKVENALIAQEFCGVLDLRVSTDRALEAITKDSDNSEDTHADKINHQRGMGPNYERLEFIGDTFLKMATTIATFLVDVGKDEFWMHCDRLTLLCNANMFNNAQRNGHVRYIRSKAFNRRTWYPEGLKLMQGKGAATSSDINHYRQNLSEKTIADVCEAMIGAALVTHVRTGYEDSACFNDAVKAVTIFVSSEEHSQHSMQCWDDYRAAYQAPKFQSGLCAASEVDMARQMRGAHDYEFKHIKLLISAFTHPSVPRAWAKSANYQRLEFLGDSLLDMTAVKHLFNTYSTRDPQWMTEHKMAMVSNKFLGALAVKLGFNKYLEFHSNAIRHQMAVFVEEFAEAQREASRSRGFWQSMSDPPKCLADMVESYVGAMFIDSNFSFAEVQRFFDTHIKWFFEDMEIYDTFANNHPINRLREFLSTSMGCKQSRLMAQENLSDDEYSSVVIAGVLIHNTVVGKGVAKTSRVAKVHAANSAHDELYGMAPFEFRRRFGCNCEAGGERQTAEDDDDTAV